MQRNRLPKLLQDYKALVYRHNWADGAAQGLQGAQLLDYYMMMMIIIIIIIMVMKMMSHIEAHYNFVRFNGHI
jgi:hypothetical protein